MKIDNDKYMVAIQAPSNINSVVKNLQYAIFKAKGLVSAILFSPCIPVLFSDVPVDRKTILSRTYPATGPVRTGDYVFHKNCLYLEILQDTAAIEQTFIWTWLRDKLQKSEIKAFIDPFPGFFLAFEEEPHAFESIKDLLFPPPRLQWRVCALQCTKLNILEGVENWWEGMYSEIIWSVKLRAGGKPAE
ncbi:MAG: hypothetical protein AB1798_07660 [Spirochaetota bacterium]